VSRAYQTPPLRASRGFLCSCCAEKYCNNDCLRPRRQSPHTNVDQWVQTPRYSYDWLGNTQTSEDDAGGFYDRPLGIIADCATKQSN
jgi:hypothetical protein